MRPRRSVQERGGRIVVGGEVRADRAQQLRDVGGDAFALRRELSGEFVQQRGRLPIGPVGGKDDRGPAFVDVADAFERLEVGCATDQRAELMRQRRILQRLVAAEDGVEL